jgi:hypothetical protein
MIERQDQKVARTWDEVSREYTRRNPDDPVGPKMAWKLGKRAMRKLRDLLEDTNEGER